MLTVRLPEELAKRLTHLAQATNRPKSFYVRQALERSLEDMEDAYLAEAEYERFKASGEEAVPLEELVKRHGLEG